MSNRISLKTVLIASLALVILAAAVPPAPLGAQAKAKTPAAKDADPYAGLSLGAFKLRSIGPALTSGRISDFAVDPRNKSAFFVASSSGGVWKTVNAGTTFTPVFDAQGSYSIGCVVLDPSNPNVVWVGTGENNNQRSVAYGDGVYKSVDGGASWKNVGLKASEHIGMIAVDPRATDTVYVAAYGPLWSPGGDRGLYKTTDGGKTWAAVLTVDENTGISEVHLDPRDPDVLYATAHQRRRHVFTQISGGPGSAVYKSADAGKTWEKIVAGLPGGDLGRIGLALSPVVPNLLYAIVEAQEDNGGFYRSTERRGLLGAAERLHLERQLLPGARLRSQGPGARLLHGRLPPGHATTAARPGRPSATRASTGTPTPSGSIPRTPTTTSTATTAASTSRSTAAGPGSTCPTCR